MEPRKVTADAVIAAYVKTRDEIAAKKKEFEDWEKGQKEVQAKREAWLQAELQRLGLESFKSPHGTVFQTYKSYCNVQDWDSFLNFVLANEAFDMLEHRASKKAVEAHMGEEFTTPPPPGIAYSREKVVQIRRK